MANIFIMESKIYCIAPRMDTLLVQNYWTAVLFFCCGGRWFVCHRSFFCCLHANATCVDSRSVQRFAFNQCEYEHAQPARAHKTDNVSRFKFAHMWKHLCIVHGRVSVIIQCMFFVMQMPPKFLLLSDCNLMKVFFGWSRGEQGSFSGRGSSRSFSNTRPLLDYLLHPAHSYPPHST